MTQPAAHTVKISKRINPLSESITLKLTAMSKKMEGVIGFNAGEPDFDTPDFIKYTAIEDIAKGVTKYTESDGIPALREAVVAKLKADQGLDFTPKQVVISNGGKHSLFNIILTITDDGDEVLIPAPYWVSYPDQVLAAGGKPVFIDCPASQGFKMTPAQLEAKITPRTVALVLNSPSNPTGAVYSKQELAALGAVLLKYPQVLIISDEIYEKLLYDGAEHHSIAAVCPELKPRTFVVGGWAKAYSMTGWRLGFAAGPQEYMSAISRLQSHATSNVCSFTQRAAAVALKGDQAFLKGWVKEFDDRRKFIVERLSAIPGVTCDAPKGAFYVFPDVSGTYDRIVGKGPHPEGKSMAWAMWLLEKHKVSLVPGIGFGDDNCVRLSYAMAMSKIKEGIERIEKALGK